jgi:hypothetical protein
MVVPGQVWVVWVISGQQTYESQTFPSFSLPYLDRLVGPFNVTYLLKPRLLIPTEGP